MKKLLYIQNVIVKNTEGALRRRNVFIEIPSSLTTPAEIVKWALSRKAEDGGTLYALFAPAAAWLTTGPAVKPEFRVPTNYVHRDGRIEALADFSPDALADGKPVLFKWVPQQGVNAGKVRVGVSRRADVVVIIDAEVAEAPSKVAGAEPFHNVVKIASVTVLKSGSVEGYATGATVDVGEFDALAGSGLVPEIPPSEGL